MEELSREQLAVLARELLAANGELADRCARAEERAATAEERVAVLEAANAELAARLARVERLLSRNSKNSGMRPSRDDEPGRTPPADPAPDGEDAPEGAQKKEKRKRGKQPGARGARMEWNDNPDRTIGRFPGGACACGADLAGAADLGVVASHQQTEIPPVSVTVTQYDLHAVLCACGKVHTAPRPEGLSPNKVSFGPNLQAWCVYLMVAHAVPVHRCAGLLAALSGAAPSVGFVHGMLARAAAAVAVANAAVRTLLTLAHAVCCDETPLRVGPKKAKKYLLVACTPRLTYYMLGDRDLATFKKFVLPDLTGVIVHDRYQNYDNAAFDHLSHQLCTQHLIRDLEDAAETYPGEVWPVQVQRSLRGLIHAANTARAADPENPHIDPEARAELAGEFRQGVLVGLSKVPPGEPRGKQPVGRVLLETLRDREADVLRFAYDLRVPPTSNEAERDLRPSKTQQNASGRLQSEEVTRHRYDIRGYISTVAKHGDDVLAAIRDALIGRPWMPPDPEPT
jgi:transposase